jgi:hypothetical protein
MNFFAISIPLLIGGAILIWMTHRTLRLSRSEQLKHLCELAKMHKEIREKVYLMDNRYIQLKALADKIGNEELIHESDKILEENAQLKGKLMSFEAVALGSLLKPQPSSKEKS